MFSPRLLIFDFDGTLADTMPVHFVAWTETLQRYGLEFSEDRFYALGGWPSSRIIELLARERGLELDVTAIAQEKEQAFLDRLHEVQAVPYVAEVLRENAGRVSMAVATGAVRPVLDLALAHLNMVHYFKTTVTAEDTVRHKPDPDVFLEAARRLNVPPNECLVYEDADLGVEAARRAGMACVDIRAYHTPRRIT